MWRHLVHLAPVLASTLHIQDVGPAITPNSEHTHRLQVGLTGTRYSSIEFCYSYRVLLAY